MFAGVLCVTIDLAVVLIVRLRRQKVSNSDTIRKRKSEFFTDDPDGEITVKNALEDYEETKLEQTLGVKNNTNLTSGAEAQQTTAEEPSEAKTIEKEGEEIPMEFPYDRESYDEKFSEESIPNIFVPQSQEEAIISNGMMTYDELLSVLDGVNSAPFKINVESSHNIDKIFNQFAQESQQEKGEESLDESEGYPDASENYDDDPSQGFNPEEQDEEGFFGNNPN